MMGHYKDVMLKPELINLISNMEPEYLATLESFNDLFSFSSDSLTYAEHQIIGSSAVPVAKNSWIPYALLSDPSKIDFVNSSRRAKNEEYSEFSTFVKAISFEIEGDSELQGGMIEVKLRLGLADARSLEVEYPIILEANDLAGNAIRIKNPTYAGPFQKTV